MSTKLKYSKEGNYYSGGLAELISSPTPLTYSFLADWFTGNGSLGKAMKLLGMPCEESDLPVLALQNNELVVDLTNEEHTLYQHTIFKYSKQNDIHETPKLVIDRVKLVRITCLINTLRILFVQSRWIAHPKMVIETAKRFVDDIPSESDGNVEEVDELLKNNVWPNVIAVGLLSEFYNQLIVKEAKTNIINVNNYISGELAKNDWFFRSIADQGKVKQHTLDFSTYIQMYGLRADKDYELTCPRWYEIADIIKKRIDSYTDTKEHQLNTFNADKKLRSLIDTLIALQLLRSESKRKTLIHINQLRKAVLRATKGMDDISSFAKKHLINREFPVQQIHNILRPTEATGKLSVLSGKGVSVSQGNAIGLAIHITNNDIAIPQGTIGVFSHASPEFAIQYPKCAGMIFLKGGQTSHGAIVAREFGIPAIIDSKAQGIMNTSKIELNATTGEWRIL